MTTIALAPLAPLAVVAVTDLDAPAKLHVSAMPTGVTLREPDMYDEGRAFWFSADGVVSVEVQEIDLPGHVLDQAHRIEITGRGWRRVHPSEYGVDVDSFHLAADGEPAAHTAQEAWLVLEATVTA